MSARQLSNEQKLRLLKVWKEICVEYEEYEILSDEFSEVLANTKDDDNEIWWEM